MAATTLINVTINLVHNGYKYGDKSFVYGLWSVWWINVAATLWIAFGLIHTLYVAFTRGVPIIELTRLLIARPCTIIHSNS